jgi:hypothetical protein
MMNILDKMEAVASRWFYLICIAIFVYAISLFIVLNTLCEKPVYDIPNGACYCPSCGAVMVLEGKE